MDKLQHSIFQEATDFMASYNADIPLRDHCNIYDALCAVCYENVAAYVAADIKEAQGDDLALVVDYYADKLLRQASEDVTCNDAEATMTWIFDELVFNIQDIVEPLFNERLTYTSLQAEEHEEVLLTTITKWAHNEGFGLGLGLEK